MAKSPVAPLHIEWSPDWVRAFNPATGQLAEGPSLADVATVTNGNKAALVAVSRPNVFLKSTRLPRAAADDVRRILMVQMAQLFPLPADQLAFDFIQTSDVTADGALTIIGAIRAEDLKRLRGDLKQAGLTALRVFPIALASGPVAARAGFKDALIAEAERNTIGLDVVLGGLPRLSRTAPKAADGVVEAQRTLAAAKAGPVPIVEIGSQAIPGATAGLDSTLALLHEAPSFHFNLAEDRVNEAAQRVAARSRLAVLMLLAAMLLVGLVWADRQDAQSSVKAAQGKNARALVRKQSILQHDMTNATELSQVRGTLHQAFASAQPLSDIAGVVADSLPQDAWLTGMMVERGKALEVRGASKTAASVGKFVDKLSASDRFRDVRLVFANSALIGKVPVVQFNVTATCVGNLPMPVPEKKTTLKTTTSTSTTGGGQ